MAIARVSADRARRPPMPHWAGVDAIDVMPHAMFGLMPGIHNVHQQESEEHGGSDPAYQRTTFSAGDFLPDDVDWTLFVGPREPPYNPDPREIAETNARVATRPAPKVAGMPECAICKDANVQTSYSPCGHAVSCGACAEAMRQDAGGQSFRCAICKVPVKDINPLLFCTQPLSEDD